MCACTSQHYLRLCFLLRRSLAGVLFAGVTRARWGSRGAASTLSCLSSSAIASWIAASKVELMRRPLGGKRWYLTLVILNQ